ncbi:MAG TPA: hydrolase [Candidatus Copromorpha excrementavium]|uniref:Hydrolase n=1 Tax=Candidatus Allocopromorpha excrementavium TaxID=2840741 RepID=A0A9D1HCI6_9FIRM|nr:hydrolase [Candidatus Copromorpha excrementavium]
MDFITRDDTILVAIDFQERLMPVMQDKEELAERSARLLKGMKALGVPVLVTQQYTKGIGETVEQIAEALEDFEHIEKTSFGCMNNGEFAEKIKKSGKKNVVVCGIEAHICVMQTVLQLMNEGYRVYLAADCVSSRNKNDMSFGIMRMRDAGAVVTTYEAILYEMLMDSKAEGFKEISKIVK